MSWSASDPFNSEWGELQSLWIRVKAVNASLATPPTPGQPPKIDPTEINRIDELLAAKPSTTNWEQLNLAELAVGAYLPPSILAEEYDTLLDLAKERKLAVAGYETKRDDVVKPPTSEDQRIRQVSTYSALLYVLQSNFNDTRFRRRLKRETAQRLLVFGGIIVAVAAVILLLALNSYFGTLDGKNGLVETIARLSIVAGFGVLGAYFSRATNFQAKISEFSFEDVINVYHTRVLVLRLLYGMIGAIIFYYLLRSGLIGGEVFPSWSVAVTPKDAKAVPVDTMGDLAKLLVWSFIAGFSERLVPDALERTEAQLKKE